MIIMDDRIIMDDDPNDNFPLHQSSPVSFADERKQRYLRLGLLDPFAANVLELLV